MQPKAHINTLTSVDGDILEDSGTFMMWGYRGLDLEEGRL